MKGIGPITKGGKNNKLSDCIPYMLLGFNNLNMKEIFSKLHLKTNYQIIAIINNLSKYIRNVYFR